MRGAAKLAVGLATLVAVVPAHAATIVVFENPETLEQRMVVVDPNGPDRVIMCMLPPGEAGCHRLPWRRGS